ncbi:MAG: PIN domain-containing protein [Erysipelotrichaceae bacterium]|nr:PIN domain-containing protein [Erysipelotrichaceae bacterium]
MKVLIDTCVSLDFIQQREPFFEDAKKLFEAVRNEEIEGYITVKSLMDIHYVIKHILHDEKAVRTILENLLVLMKLLDSSANDAAAALHSNVTDYEDALMAETAVSKGMDHIVTRNIRDYKNAAIAALMPGELIG